MTKRNYNDPVYKRARSKVLKRDGHKCQMPNCGSKYRLNVHHIHPWSSAPSMRFEEYNLITLCRKCHDSIKNQEHLYISLFMSIARENGNSS
jgi:5-methylcytosine-specific restriction endonuclease McrA